MSTPTTTATSTTQLPSEQVQVTSEGFLKEGPMAPEKFNVQFPGGQNMTFQLPPGHPADIPGARVSAWTTIPEARLPTDLPPTPQGFRVVQYERDIEIDLANLSVTPTTLITTPYTTICQPCEPCKPEIQVETSTVPPTQLDTQRRDIPGGEEVVTTGPHGEKVKTTVTQLPSGGERIETKVKESLADLPQGEDILTKTTFKECGGGVTTVESHTKLVPPEKVVVTEPLGHHHEHDQAPRQGKIGHHHHDTSLGGLIKGAFGRKHGEHAPKETM